jgi:ribosomal protein S18 acetylase RimI-like enzyme
MTRGYQLSDIPALNALLNVVEEHAGGHPGLTFEETRSLLTTMVRDSAADSRLVFAPDGTLVAAALTPTPPQGGFRVDLFGGVHPHWRGRGIGRELLSWQLGRAGEIHRAVAPDTRWQAHVGAVVGDEETERLCQRFAMTPVRYWLEMVANTEPTRAVPPPQGLRIAGYRPEYEQPLHAAHMEAFGDHWGYQRRGLDEWLALTVRSDSCRPDLSLLAFDGDEIAGYVLSYQDADPARIYIGQVGVRRPWRRRGLAQAMLVQVLAWAGRAGKKTAALGVDADSPTGAVGVYERAGFTIEYRAVTYSLPLP